MSNSKWRRLRRWLVILIGIGVVTFPVVIWQVGGGLVAPANQTVGEPPDDFPAVAVQIDSESGSKLAGWYLPVRESDATVLLLHPIRGNRRSMLSRARLFQQHGYSTLLIDLQGHGESPGRNITIGHLEQHDVHAAVAFIRERDADQKIAIVGRSLGGASAVFANPEIDVLVLESVYPTVTEAVHNRVQMRMGFLHHIFAPLLLVQLKPRLGISPGQLQPIDGLSEIHCPILFASGDCDEHTTIAETQRMFEAANEPKQLIVFEGAAHVDLLAHDRAKYEEQVVGFVNRITDPGISSD